MSLEEFRTSMEGDLNRPPTGAEWAAAAGIDQGELTRAIKWGRECRQHMAASNMRLVVSVAKKYTTRGLALEELITVRSTVLACSKLKEWLLNHLEP